MKSKVDRSLYTFSLKQQLYHLNTILSLSSSKKGSSINHHFSNFFTLITLKKNSS